MASVAILIPTFQRLDRLPDVVANAQTPDARVYLIMEPQEAEEGASRLQDADVVILTRPEGFGNYATSINYGYEQTKEPFVFAAADDLRFFPGWLDVAMERMNDRVRVVGTNDLGNREVLAGVHATHYLVARDYLEAYGGTFDGQVFLPECYDHNWTDKEFIRTAELRGVWTPCLDSIVEHRHVSWGKAAMDATYRKSFAQEAGDAALARDRMARIEKMAAEGTLNRPRSALVSIPTRRKWSVAIVTPWRDHTELRADYFAAVKAARPDELLIVDDGSHPPIKEAAFRFDESVGYVRSSNKGLELSTADVVVFLNNDIRLVDEKWLDRLVALCEPGLLVGQLRQHAFAWVDGEPQPYIDGWCIAGMREDFERLGGFDPTFHEPAYYCDNDLCLRATLADMGLVDTWVGLEHKSNGTTNDDVAARERAAEINHGIYWDRVHASRMKAAA